MQIYEYTRQNETQRSNRKQRTAGNQPRHRRLFKDAKQMKRPPSQTVDAANAACPVAKPAEAAPSPSSSPAASAMTGAGAGAQITLPITGTTCASCSARVEKLLARMDGVSAASVNLALEKASISYDDKKNAPAAFIQTIKDAGFDVPTQKLRLSIDGMTCASCAARIEKQLRKRPEVLKANINLALERGDFEIIAGTSEHAIIQTIRDTGFDATPPPTDMMKRAGQQKLHEQRQRQERRRDLIDLTIGAVLTLPLVAQMALSMLGVGFSLPPAAELLLATPVMFYVGRRFFVGAYKALKTGGANMDVLVAIGTSAAYFFSLFMMLRLGAQAKGHLYFEAAAVIITLILLGKILENRAKQGTTKAILELMNLRPQTARVLRGGEEVELAVEEVMVGDEVVVRPGEKIPVDGVVREGRSTADEALITGESLPVAKAPGDEATGGAINGAGRLIITTSRVGADTTLGRIIKLGENAQSGKAPVQRLVDKVAAVFVPVVLAISALTFLGWLLIAGAGFETALIAAVSVLVIACPCALGLATPTAIVAGTGAAARAGVLFRSVEALETAHRVNMVMFDKTGTLTRGQPTLVEQKTLGGEPERMLQLAASVQHASEHPLARAVLEKAADEGVELLPVSDFQSQPGRGVSAKVDGHRLLIGNLAQMQEAGIEPDKSLLELLADWQKQSRTAVFVASDGKILGLLAIADSVRPQSRAAINKLQTLGVRVMMLSGDAPHTARAIAEQLGMSEYRGGVRPEDKAAEIEAQQRDGMVVAMVGDGVNDAPALALADVGVAMGSGSDAAMETAGVTLMRSDPRLVAATLDASKATWRKLQQNLFWAFVYNLIGIPLAVMGLLNPALAGAAMAMSSISVVSNSLLLRRWKPKLEE